MEPEETIEISKQHYEDLLDDRLMLNSLESAGVDNWSGYDYALEMYHEEKNNA